MCNKLEEDRNEIRILHIAKNSSQDTDSILRCNLRTVSLLDLKPSFVACSPTFGQDKRQQDVLAKWIKTISPSYVVNKFNLQKVPYESQCRFEWGDFATLSYTWGDPTITEIIIINSVEVQVHKNLADALRVFRRLNWFQPSHYGLWVDAVCINQMDMAEQSAQVNMMRTIFANSWTTVAYLGNATENSRLAIELLKALAGTWSDTFEVAPSMVSELEADPGAHGHGRWLALHEFLQRPYWLRLWIVQEIVLAPDNMSMFAGYDSISWRQVRDGLSAIHVNFWFVKNTCLAHDRKLAQPGEALLDSWDTRSLHHIDKDMARIAMKEDLGEKRMLMSELLEVASATLASRPVDKVYGLLGVMPVEVARQITVDYEIDEARLFETVARIFIRHEATADILRSGSLWNTAKTASWAPDWTSEQERRDMLKPQLHYAADKGTTQTISFSPNGRLLTARGVILDEIGCASHLGRMSSKAATIETATASTSVASDIDFPTTEIRIALHRTMLGARSGMFGQYLSQINPASCSYTNSNLLFALPDSFDEAMVLAEQRAAADPGWSQLRMLRSRYEDWVQWRRINGDLLLDSDDLKVQVPLSTVMWSENLPADTSSDAVFGALNRFRHMQAGRRFITTRHGRFGWVPENKTTSIHAADTEDSQVKDGDLFVLIFGCSVPLVVRPCGSRFQVLGEGYLDGFMDGEALEEIKSERQAVLDLTFI